MKQSDDKMLVTPPPDYVFRRDDRMLIIGSDTNISTFCDLSS
ncbi:MAG: hypothetical protein ACK44M_07940 [Chloroflexus sp.]